MYARHESDAMHGTASIRFQARWREGFLAIIAAGLFLAAMAPEPAQAENGPVTMRFSTQLVPAISTYRSIQHFKERVEQESKGGLVIDVHHSAKLYSDSQVGDAIASGAIEMGQVNLSRYAGTMPIADAFQLPFVFNTTEFRQAATAPGSEIRTLIERTVLTKAGSRVLWWIPMGQAVFLADGVSVADPEKIAGKTVRTFGPTIEALVRNCGGQPKDIGGPEQAKAYEKREVDVGMAPISAVAGRKLWRSMNTITRTNHASVQFVVVINEKYWQSLPADQRAILAGAARAADIEARSIEIEDEANAYKELAKDGGVKIVSLTDDELQCWRVCSSDLLEWFLQKAGPSGLKLMQAYGRMRKEPGSDSTPPAPSSVAAKRAPAAPQ
jgi:C4-dicarboxylate-binding protein DctP